MCMKTVYGVFRTKGATRWTQTVLALLCTSLVYKVLCGIFCGGVELFYSMLYYILRESFNTVFCFDDDDIWLVGDPACVMVICFVKLLCRNVP